MTDDEKKQQTVGALRELSGALSEIGSMMVDIRLRLGSIEDLLISKGFLTKEEIDDYEKAVRSQRIAASLKGERPEESLILLKSDEGKKH